MEKMTMIPKVVVALTLCAWASGPLLAAELDGAEIVAKCEYKNAGQDQRSRLTVTLIEKDGGERKSVYRRLWKNYLGQGDLVDKMVLNTEFPPDAEGTSFMRWGYTGKSGKPADQWLYLPQLRKTRRVSVRDPGDSFLGSDLTYSDIDDRPVDADQHTLLRTEQVQGKEYYVVESVPKSKGLYAKRVSWYTKTPDMGNCVRAKTDYYDRQGLLQKVQMLSWQTKNGAWSWDTVAVENVQTKHKSVFKITDVEVNVGLQDRQFTERAIAKGE